MSTPRTRIGCQNCRDRHLKCDDNQSACARCLNSGLECVRGVNIRFKHSSSVASAGRTTGSLQFSWLNDQVWLLNKRNDSLIFLDETESVVRSYEGDTEDGRAGPQEEIGSPAGSKTSYLAENVGEDVRTTPPVPIDRRDALISSPSKRQKHIHSMSLDGSISQRSPTSFTPVSLGELVASPVLTNRSPVLYDFSQVLPAHGPRPASISRVSTISDSRSEVHRDTDSVFEANRGSTAYTRGTHSFPEVPPELLSPTYLDAPIWPLASLLEAKLMRYFVEVLATWFDMCDPERHFALIIPQRAAVCPTLLYAIFAVSARHQDRLRYHDSYVADRYQQKCLSHLRGMMFDEVACMDESLLAATVVLRLLEEVEVPLSGFDLQSHLVGTKALINAQDSSTHPQTGVRLACFWIALRQEVQAAFLAQRDTWHLDHVPLDRSLEPTDDYSWANRMVLHLADVLHFCFAETGNQTTARWIELRAHAHSWRSSLPQSFSPMYTAPPDPAGGRTFPEIWQTNTAHVVGLQHFHIVQILLAAHDPTIPRLGPGRKAKMDAMDEDIRGLALQIIGLALSNDSISPHLVLACVTISIVGEKFTDRNIQKCLLELMERTDRLWPTAKMASELKEAWRWTDDT